MDLDVPKSKYRKYLVFLQFFFSRVMIRGDFVDFKSSDAYTHVEKTVTNKDVTGNV